MKIKCVIDKGSYMPTKAHKADAGFDLYTPEYVTVEAFGAATIDTGVHVEIPEGYVGFIKSKSGLNVKLGLRAEGVIDSGYTGSIVVKVYNDSIKAYTFARGDKITQLVILPIPSVELEKVDSLEDTERGANGFGSSGR